MELLEIVSLYKHLQSNGNMKRTIPRTQHTGTCHHTANLCATDHRIDLFASPNTNYWTHCQSRPTECLRHKPSNVRFDWPHHTLFGSPWKHTKTGAISKEVITEAACNKQRCHHVDINQIWQPSQRYMKQISCIAVTLSPTATPKTVTPVGNPVASLTGHGGLSEREVKTGNFRQSNDFSLWHWLGIPPTR